jgi:hypothetical protein
MARYKKTNRLSGTDAAYIAGLIDGEGTIGLVRKHRNDYRQLGISISSTEPALLEFVQTACGTGVISSKRRAKAHHNPSQTFAVYNRQALDLLKQVHPYLRSYKKERSRLILRDYLDITPRNGRYSAEMLDRKRAFEDSVMSIKAHSHVNQESD